MEEKVEFNEGVIKNQVVGSQPKKRGLEGFLINKKIAKNGAVAKIELIIIAVIFFGLSIYFFTLN